MNKDKSVLTVKQLNNSRKGSIKILPVNLQDSIIIGNRDMILNQIIGYVNNHTSTVLITHPLTDFHSSVIVDSKKNSLLINVLMDDLNYHFPTHRIEHRVMQDSLRISLWDESGDVSLSTFINKHILPDADAVEVYDDGDDPDCLDVAERDIQEHYGCDNSLETIEDDDFKAENTYQVTHKGCEGHGRHDRVEETRIVKAHSFQEACESFEWFVANCRYEIIPTEDPSYIPSVEYGEGK
jgi:hypothetical protein